LNAPIKIAPRLLFPSGLVFNSSGLLYVADYENNRIVECDLVNKRAQILVDSNILHPRSLALDGNTLYFTEALPWVRTIDLRTRVLRVVAGGRTPGFAGDGGPAIAAKMVSPFGLAADPMGNLFISDSYDNRIRRVDAKSGVISTVAGNGSPVRPDIRTIPRI
jgi:sugar lactone lactonase YvrE